MEKNITVITPTLNAEKYLNSCLNSIKKQTGLKNIDILIADGGSSQYFRYLQSIRLKFFKIN